MNIKCFIMKNPMRFLWLILALTGVLVVTSSCNKDDDDQTPQFFHVDSNGYSNMNRNQLQLYLNTLPLQSLSATEEASLLFMREEEKLAHDIYTELYNKYPLQVFAHIADSEQTHTEAVLLLLDRYALTDPALNKGIGEFANPDLQALYNTLLTRGLQSEIEALKVGALVEEVDIADLKVQLAEKVDNQDITIVYENLMKGSRNHLRAFVKNLSVRGVTYLPEVLSLTDYNEIIDSGMETGRN